MKKTVKKILNNIRLYGLQNTIVDPQLLSLNCQIRQSSIEHGAMVSKQASILNFTVGRYTSIGRNSKITHSTIGSFCATSCDRTINTIFHPLDHLTISAFPYFPEVGRFVSERIQEYEIVFIGSDVWIAVHAIVMSGIYIGNGAIIGAGAIVTRDVSAYQIMAGNPAKVLRSRFDSQTVDALLELEWWTWEDDKIKTNISYFQHELQQSDLRKLKNL